MLGSGRLSDRVHRGGAVSATHPAVTKRRILLVSCLATGFLLVAAAAWSCTVYWGQHTIENLDTSAGEFTVVGDPSILGMDRCDDPDDAPTYDEHSDTVEAHNDSGSAPGEGPDTVRVEIHKYGGSDCGGPHSLGEVDNGDPDNVWVNTYNGDAYDDLMVGTKSGVYEDDDADSDERIGDCMDRTASDVNQKAGGKDGIPVTSKGQFEDMDGDPSTGTVTDQDGDGKNEVDIVIDEAPDSTETDTDLNGFNDFAGGICVSQHDLSDSAPQIPILVK